MERPGEAVREGSLEEASKTEGSITWQGRKKVQENCIHLFSGMAGSLQVPPFSWPSLIPTRAQTTLREKPHPPQEKSLSELPVGPSWRGKPLLPSLPCWARQLWEGSQQPDFPEWGSLKSGEMDKRGTERKEGKEGRALSGRRADPQRDALLSGAPP